MEKITLSVVKAGVGGFPGHAGCHEDVVERARDHLGKASSKGALLEELFLANKKVKWVDSPTFDLAPQLIESGSGALLFWASAHSPSISVDTMVCAKSLAMRSTAGFSSLKNDCGSSES